MNGLLVIISGPSGVGKNTVIKELRKLKPDLSVFSISATTRTPRNNEKEGEDYFFISKDKFLDWVNNGKFLEWAEYNGNFYGTPKDYVVDKISNGKIVLAEIEVKGALQIMQTDTKKLSIFLMPPDKDTLLNRLKNRATDSEESISKRIEIAEWEMNQSHNFDEIVVNDVLDVTVLEINELINKKMEN